MSDGPFDDIGQGNTEGPVTNCHTDAIYQKKRLFLNRIPSISRSMKYGLTGASHEDKNNLVALGWHCSFM
jgi:hypothetical protein